MDSEEEEEREEEVFQRVLEESRLEAENLRSSHSLENPTTSATLVVRLVLN